MTIESDEVKGGLAEIDTGRSDSSGVHAMILREAQDHPTSGLIRTTDHLINPVPNSYLGTGWFQNATLCEMIEAADESRGAARQLLVVVALIAVGYLCIRILRFTNDGLNLAFVCVFLLLPFLAIKPVLRLHRWPKVLSTILLAPLLALSLVMLLFTAACDIPAALQHRELVREVSSISQGRYSVHLLWEETSGGAVGPHGVGLEQRMFIVPGLYVVKHLDYFEGARSGSLSAEGNDKVLLHIPEETGHAAINRVYSLKRGVYF